MTLAATLIQEIKICYYVVIIAFNNRVLKGKSSNPERGCSYLFDIYIPLSRVSTQGSMWSG